MAEYIDIDATIDFAVYERNRRVKATLRNVLESNDAKYELADVVSVRHGKWESSRPDAPMFGFHYCSICGRKRTSPQDNFCPNCGADMRNANN